MASSSSRNVAQANLPANLTVAEETFSIARGAEPVEADGVPSATDILSLPGGPTIDFTVNEGENQVNEAPLMGEVGIGQLREHWGIPRFADISLARRKERVHIDRRGYCIFYAYPFRLGFRNPLPMLVVDFCCYYRVCPRQLVPSLYKLFTMLINYAELA